MWFGKFGQVTRELYHIASSKFLSMEQRSQFAFNLDKLNIKVKLI